MRRGTTPTVTAELDSDLVGWDCVLTLAWAGGSIDLGADRLRVARTDGGCAVSATLTQAETLSMRAGTVSAQLRAKRGDAAVATSIGSVSVGDILRDGEL